MDREVVLEAIRRHVPELAPAPGAELKPGRVSIDVPRVLAA
jgi:hypothetical protein